MQTEYRRECVLLRASDDQSGDDMRNAHGSRSGALRAL